jgi:acyl-CoA hydrolase
LFICFGYNENIEEQILQKLVVSESLVYVYFKTSVVGKRSMHVWLEVWAGFWRSGALSLVVNNFLYMTENRYANKLLQEPVMLFANQFNLRGKS